MLGERKIWDIVWKANVSQKIRIFAWCVATNSLAVQVNRVLHHQATLSTCSICGVEDENTFHALVKCPKAYALCMAMRDIWDLLGEEVCKHSGSDWFLILLDQLNATLHNQIIFLFWSAWHLRNDLIFGKVKELVSASANFVKNYWSSFVAIQSCPEVDSKNKGKDLLSGLKIVPNHMETQVLWQPPPSEYSLRSFLVCI